MEAQGGKVGGNGAGMVSVFSASLANCLVIHRPSVKPGLMGKMVLLVAQVLAGGRWGVKAGMARWKAVRRAGG